MKSKKFIFLVNTSRSKLSSLGIVPDRTLVARTVAVALTFGVNIYGFDLLSRPLFTRSFDSTGIALNIILQDAPFLTFRLLIIIHYQIISYMNVFFTCKLWSGGVGCFESLDCTSSNIRQCTIEIIYVPFLRQEHIGHPFAIISALCRPIGKQQNQVEEEKVERPSGKTKAL